MSEPATSRTPAVSRSSRNEMPSGWSRISCTLPTLPIVSSETTCRGKKTYKSGRFPISSRRRSLSSLRPRNLDSSLLVIGIRDERTCRVGGYLLSMPNMVAVGAPIRSVSSHTYIREQLTRRLSRNLTLDLEVSRQPKSSPNVKSPIISKVRYSNQAEISIALPAFLRNLCISRSKCLFSNGS